MLVSFIINTRRDFNEFSKNILDCIFNSPNPNNYEFEILINSHQSITCESKDNRCQRIENYLEDFRHGAIYGFNKLIPYSDGEYIFFMTDDIYYNNVFSMFDYMEQTTKKKRFNISGPTIHGQSYQTNLIEYNHEAIHTDLWTKFPIVRTVVADQRTIYEELDGVIHHPAFYNGAGDLYMSWYCQHNNQAIYECPANVTNGYTLPIALKTSPSFSVDKEIHNRDMETFIDLIKRNKNTKITKYI